jgi:molybdopterin-binding protein
VRLSRQSAHFPKVISGVFMTVVAINARNQFQGIVKEIILGSVVSEIDVETPFGIVTSVITTRSVKDLDLQVGSEVLALVKATEVSIAKL